jgi:hypothetical protein
VSGLVYSLYRWYIPLTVYIHCCADSPVYPLRTHRAAARMLECDAAHVQRRPATRPAVCQGRGRHAPAETELVYRQFHAFQCQRVPAQTFAQLSEPLIGSVESPNCQCTPCVTWNRRPRRQVGASPQMRASFLLDARLCVWARVADAASVAPSNSDFISLELRAF